MKCKECGYNCKQCVKESPYCCWCWIQECGYQPFEPCCFINYTERGGVYWVSIIKDKPIRPFNISTYKQKNKRLVDLIY